MVNSMEHTKQKDGEEHDRQHVDSDVTMQDLVDSYMYPFQARRMPYPAALGATVRRYGTSPDTRPFSGACACACAGVRGEGARVGAHVLVQLREWRAVLRERLAHQGDRARRVGLRRLRAGLRMTFGRGAVMAVTALRLHMRAVIAVI